ncbi:DUF228 domain-containing protein [Borreliella burgdorferi]|uniref:DUF228 domain-containing protein n=3 Tax=Borreliella burgdorferi TaxID=139 RepID=UPI00016B3251|nr:DUF228 domain-containing protein [Borreliella burgdorferi]ACN23950.1 conserved hypothetical protein [Borreliella burgdorferi 64b]EEH31187.1 conserved hypothetical protein [Borreliella burgdorferi Bol26]
MSDITKIKQEFDKKVAEIQALMKNPQQDSGLLSNSIDFRDQNLIFSNSGGVCTSSKDKIENYPAKGYPYKRGVKLSFGDGITELEVEAGGGDDLYGVCSDIDEFSGMATVIPITNNFTGYLTLKKDGQNSVNPGDKLNFNQHGELEKATGGQKTVNAIALSKAHKLTEELFIVLASVFGNRAIKG